MKTFQTLLIAAGLVSVAASSNAALYTTTFDSGFANTGIVPDGNTTGWSDTRTLSGIDGTISEVQVFLNISGGYNGDLYAYLTHNDGTTILLNRVGTTSGNGFGYDDAGLKVTFADNAANGDIHTYQTVSGYNLAIANSSQWSPDGRAASPLTVTSSDPRSAFLAQFIGANPNGDWTLFVADLSGGSVSTVTSWGLALTIVPEPATFGIMAGVAALGFVCFQRKR